MSIFGTCCGKVRYDFLIFAEIDPDPKPEKDLCFRYPGKELLSETDLKSSFSNQMQGQDRKSALAIP